MVGQCFLLGNINENEQSDVLAGMVLDYKESFDSTLSAINDELKELNTDFHKHESDLAISRNVTEKIKKQLILVERKCWANEY